MMVTDRLLCVQLAWLQQLQGASSSSDAALMLQNSPRGESVTKFKSNLLQNLVLRYLLLTASLCAHAIVQIHTALIQPDTKLISFNSFKSHIDKLSATVIVLPSISFEYRL